MKMPSVAIVDEQRFSDVRQAVLKGLVDYNERFVGPSRRSVIAVAASDTDGRIVGGACGATYSGRLLIELLWVEEAYRGAGLGSGILQSIEAEGRRLGATRAFLDTFTFQAAPFYERHGYVEVARIVDFWDGHDRIYLSKENL